jgi:hypothetical protein
MPTGTDICTQALVNSGVLGVGNPPAADQITRALALLNNMLAVWSSKRWLNYAELDFTVTVTGAQFYTIGPGQTIDVASRPDRIEYGFIRLLNSGVSLPVDYPLRQIMSREDYSRVALKTLQTQTDSFFYDSNFPVGRIYPLPIPNLANLYELHFGTRVILPVLTTPATAISLPPEYTDAMVWNLARRVRAAWRLPPAADINALAQDGLNCIRSSNIQVPSLSMPAGLGGTGGNYNPFSDSVTNVP